jgi:hypothetical protein
MSFVATARHDEEDVVSSGAVLRAETIDRCAQTSRTRAVEVCDLNHPHG